MASRQSWDRLALHHRETHMQECLCYEEMRKAKRRQFDCTALTGPACGRPFDSAQGRQAASNRSGARRHAAGHIALEKIVELARADGFRQIAIHASSQALLA